MPQYLVTGGAGFIGRHLVRDLLSSGAAVRVLDSLIEQVHGPDPAPPAEIAGAELVRGDIRDAGVVARAVEGVEGVFHLAAEVGVGQSMYEIAHYTAVNELGTAVLLQALAERPVRRVVVASSMSVYGEGLYRDVEGRPVADAVRGSTEAGWDPRDAQGRPLVPVPTPESKPPNLASVYALGKYGQERMTHIVGRAYGIETVALRMFNVYGPGQALSNPYTGVLAIFAARLSHGQRPLVFEDGEQRRDFVHVEDIARAFSAAMERPEAAGGTFNVASGRSVGIAEVARAMGSAMGRPDLAPRMVGRARSGDVRHCFADIRRAREALSFEPRRSFDDALGELAAWVAGQGCEDRVDLAASELAERGLVA